MRWKRKGKVKNVIFWWDFIANLGAFSFGNVLCYSAVALPKLREDVAGFGGSLSEDELAWISSIVTV